MCMRVSQETIESTPIRSHEIAAHCDLTLTVTLTLTITLNQVLNKILTLTLAAGLQVRTVIAADFDNDGFQELFYNQIPGQLRCSRSNSK